MSKLAGGKFIYIQLDNKTESPKKRAHWETYMMHTGLILQNKGCTFSNGITRASSWKYREPTWQKGNSLYSLTRKKSHEMKKRAFGKSARCMKDWFYKIKDAHFQMTISEPAVENAKELLGREWIPQHAADTHHTSWLLWELHVCDPVWSTIASSFKRTMYNALRRDLPETRSHHLCHRIRWVQK